MTGCRERAAALLRTADQPIAETCHAFGLRSLGSFTTVTCAPGTLSAAYCTACTLLPPGSSLSQPACCRRGAAARRADTAPKSQQRPRRTHHTTEQGEDMLKQLMTVGVWVGNQDSAL